MIRLIEWRSRIRRDNSGLVDRSQRLLGPCGAMVPQSWSSKAPQAPYRTLNYRRKRFSVPSEQRNTDKTNYQAGENYFKYSVKEENKYPEKTQKKPLKYCNGGELIVVIIR